MRRAPLAARDSKPLSGPTKSCPAAATTSAARAPPTPGSTTATWIVPGGNSGAACASATAPATTSCGGIPWVMSTSCACGAIERTTPFIAPAYPSLAPKSVVKVTIGKVGPVCHAVADPTRYARRGPGYHFGMDKTVTDADAAVADLFDGATLMAGGFGLCGIPENLIAAIRRKGTKNLTIISNNCGIDSKGLGILLANGQVRKMIGSYVGENKTFERLYIEKKLEVELTPQGTLAERIRAGGAGIPAFYTATGYGTMVAEGKETREFGGRNYVLEHALHADFSLVKAWKGDRFGNLVYRKTTRNFNPMIAAAGKTTIAEVEILVEPGELEPDHVHSPGIYVQRIIKGPKYEKPIEQRTVRKRSA